MIRYKEYADEAKAVSKEAIDIATDAKEKAEEVDGVAEEAKNLASQALDTSENALETARGIAASVDGNKLTIKDGQGKTTEFVDTDTNTKNVTKISGSKDKRGVMTITVQETTTEFENGKQVSEKTETNKIEGIASTQYVDNSVGALGNRIERLGTRISKVGAGAAALANLHPVNNPGTKLSMALAGGTYRSEQAMAMGAFYKPTDNVMISMSGTLGNGDNMFGVGVSFALDGIKKPVISPTQFSDLKAENAEIKAKNEKIEAELAELKAMVQALKDAK